MTQTNNWEKEDKKMNFHKAIRVLMNKLQGQTKDIWYKEMIDLYDKYVELEVQEQITLAKEEERKRILEEIWREMANTKNLPARAGIVDLYELQKIINKIK